MPPQGMEARQYYNTTPDQRIPASAEIQSHEVVRGFEAITQQAAAERLRELQEEAVAANGEAQGLATSSAMPEQYDETPELHMSIAEMSERIIGLGVNLSHYRYNKQTREESLN